ncbi:hypothetical protein LshimejAT787_0702750 [Lyophyllum shimeji]|uniref:Uncharacterized protein n=1 Tax=Lyophyllum shimeji TaxID=47721 RepID=A0A9P3PNN1_LYOSH|nr:hypothetical protein LshimejAT787_0702750 [Lyophyllum shimeji]
MEQTNLDAGPCVSSSMSALESYASYPFATDETYQQGLASLIAGGALEGHLTQEAKDEVLRRTRVFYFNRVTGSALSMDDARNYEYSLRTSNAREKADTSATPVAVQSATSDDETRVLTFAELKELIESGKVDQIPNNKVIPELLNDAPPSQSSAPTRKKPWERALATA